MPRRIFIKDGGLSASIPTPTGYTVIGSDNGIPKKQNKTYTFRVRAIRKF